MPIRTAKSNPLAGSGTGDICPTSVIRKMVPDLSKRTPAELSAKLKNRGSSRDMSNSSLIVVRVPSGALTKTLNTSLFVPVAPAAVAKRSPDAKSPNSNPMASKDSVDATGPLTAKNPGRSSRPNWAKGWDESSFINWGFSDCHSF